ncbi:hypothetical protein DL89DRAFT_264398 [Linderina pennispora]|uniref:Uncharacterized protein n=1 Tax=Linderina pennispora TaxID=61395 RepID=A0A1Y1WLX2_9FUNG|nr:uncharacterized protein DL89DRAFT_264398 [Linderina pennispora]ORX74560.1 hypothetical protein DL89DRAFT_264398 [Linderina pennispora]
MQSSVTLVAVEGAVAAAQQEERAYLENSPTSAMAPERRPHSTQTPNSLSHTTGSSARARRQSAPGYVASTARVARSNSEQTYSTKTAHGLASRLKRKLKGVNSYYSVSTH